MKKVFLKSLLLLCALIVGSSSAWAVDKTITITIGSFTDVSSGYGTYSWTANGVSGKGQIYGDNSTNMQMNGSNANGKLIYSTTPIFGKIKSIKITRANSGSNRSYEVYGGTSAYSGSGDSYGTSLGSKSVNTSGVTWTISSGNYDYFVIRNTTTNACYLSQIVVTYEESTYTISPTANTSEMGNVSVSGNIITATPNTGYRVKSGSEGYTVTSGTANVINNGDNTFTVVPSGNCAVQINFESIPTHTITATSVSGGSITIKKGDDIITSGTAVAEGVELTIIATANEGKTFREWNLTNATPNSSTSKETTFIVGIEDISISATFTDKETFAIHWSVNGIVVRTDNVIEEDNIVFPDSPDGIPSGCILYGWSETSILSPQNTAPSIVSEAICVEEKTYYAVLIILTKPINTYTKLTSDSFDSEATYILGGRQSADDATTWYLKSYANVDGNSSWGVASSDPDEAITFSLSGTAAKLVAKDNRNNYLTALSSGNFKMSSSSQTVYLDESGNIRNPSSTSYYLRHNYNGGNGGFRWYSGSNAMNAAFYKVIYGTEKTQSYCTTIPSAIVTPSSETGKHYATFFAPYNAKLDAGIAAYIGTYAANTLTLHVLENSETGTVIPANTPVVLKSTSEVAFNVVATADEESEVHDGTLLTANNLHGTLAATEAPANAYVLGYNSAAGQETGFYQFSGTIPANRAYLIISGGAAQAAGIRIVEGENNATSMENIEANHEVVKFVENGQLLIKRDGITYDALGRIVE